MTVDTSCAQELTSGFWWRPDIARFRTSFEPETSWKTSPNIRRVCVLVAVTLSSMSQSTPWQSWNASAPKAICKCSYTGWKWLYKYTNCSKFGLKVSRYCFNNFETRWVLPEPEGPTTITKHWGLVPMILFLALAKVWYTQSTPIWRQLVLCCFCSRSSCRAEEKDDAGRHNQQYYSIVHQQYQKWSITLGKMHLKSNLCGLWKKIPLL